MKILQLEELIPLLECPNSHTGLAYLDNPDNLLSIKKEAQIGKLILASGEVLPEPPSGILTSLDGFYQYPIINGIPFLLKDSYLVDKTSERKVLIKTDEMALKQKEQMAQFSQMHHRWYRKITDAQQKILRSEFYVHCKNHSVLDIGNGGQQPEIQLGEVLSRQIKQFIALDKSFDMICQNGLWGNQILGDALCLPLKARSVDFVLANGILHHFGKTAENGKAESIDVFFSEAMRICRKGIIAMELIVPPVAERIESVILRIKKFMPTYVYSLKSLTKKLNKLNLYPSKIIYKKITDLLPPFDILPPILDYQWFRVPICIVPYAFVFFYLQKK